MHSSVLREADAHRISTLINGFYGSAAVLAAAELGIFAELSRLRKSAADVIARQLNLNPNGTTLLLDACVALGLLEKEGSLYKNGVETETYLVPGSPLDLSSQIRDARESYPCWTHLPEFVRTGVPINRRRSGQEADEERLTASLLASHMRILTTGRSIIRRMDLQGRKELLEVGGPGTYSVLASLEFPQLHCTVLDRPEALKVVSALIEQQDASQHVSILAGDFRTATLTRGTDIVLLFNILHSSPPGEVPALLRRIADSLNPGGVVYVMDTMTDETHTMPSASVLFGLNLALTSPGGRVFSHVELQDWMMSAGLQEFAVETLPHPISQWLARARKPA